MRLVARGDTDCDAWQSWRVRALDVPVTSLRRRLPSRCGNYAEKLNSWRGGVKGSDTTNADCQRLGESASQVVRNPVSPMAVGSTAIRQKAPLVAWSEEP